MDSLKISKTTNNDYPYKDDIQRELLQKIEDLLEQFDKYWLFKTMNYRAGSFIELDLKAIYEDFFESQVKPLRNAYKQRYSSSLSLFLQKYSCEHNWKCNDYYKPLNEEVTKVWIKHLQKYSENQSRDDGEKQRGK